MPRFFLPVLLLVLLCPAPTRAQQAPLPEIALKVQGHALSAEVATSDASRQQGLMFRRVLPEDRGMLFVFRETAPQAMWMMNTYLPLSVAFIDDRGVILNIEDMKPLTTDIHPSKGAVKYALEMNLGWFKKRGIKPGARIEGLERAPPSQ